MRYRANLVPLEGPNLKLAHPTGDHFLAPITRQHLRYRPAPLDHRSRDGYPEAVHNAKVILPNGRLGYVEALEVFWRLRL